MGGRQGPAAGAERRKLGPGRWGGTTSIPTELWHYNPERMKISLLEKMQRDWELKKRASKKKTKGVTRPVGLEQRCNPKLRARIEEELEDLT